MRTQGLIYRGAVTLSIIYRDAGKWNVINRGAGNQSPLLPSQVRRNSFFIYSVFSTTPGKSVTSVRRPIFSVSAGPSLGMHQCRGNGGFIRIAPSIGNLTAIRSESVLVFYVSRMVTTVGSNRRSSVHPALQFGTCSLLATAGHNGSKQKCRRLHTTLRHLSKAQVAAGMAANSIRILSKFNLVSHFHVIHRAHSNHVRSVRIALSR